MKELIISEFLRMRGRRKNKASFIIVLVNFIFSISWYKTFGEGTGVYTPGISTKINSLNLPIFVMKDLASILFLIVLPMLFIDSLSGEYESGAYRLILIRPYSKIKLWFSKLIAQSLFSLVIFVVFFILSVISGYILFPKATVTNFYNIPKAYDQLGAFIYNFKVIALMYFVSIAILALASLISSIVSKSVAAFLIVISFLIAGIYIGHGLQVIFLPFHNIIRLLSLGKRADFYIPVVSCLLICSFLSTLIFTRKDLKC
ncbi:ABC transporter permease [Clostridium botulinum]|uniref:Putative membrane protein n=1 Tax=Clostridium botulinum (strain Langeland / NCTC 10281 / Type F) TaxID=441772 RepID=A7GEP0_CLOBL|nr:ABC transporter permease subunit [Clostridium botulinum]ABS42211.1 putative membrane protein [Clostridium botulinum F str. Langeland]ADF99663.1 putative membrane protein [Clostridium botulinum F str. 230613]KKM42761.1 membrane protein [Clostridium botulinum]MBY6791721.1 ABC transporter permease subunit [Clostridium botulinum]MBY6936958.1 ABC transporter permease subunit [Clostridium botulinum]